MSTTAGVNERLAALTSAGTSVWLDQIRRSLIEGGELARMVNEESLRGVTANPSIFEKAILGSDDYDEDLESMAREGLDAQTIYDRIAVRDVQLAADVLADVYRDTHGRDGFVSLEVAPDIAHDTERTLAAVRTYWKAVSRPNVMIKIPGTPEARRRSRRRSTRASTSMSPCLFAVDAYERVAEAFLRGLERRQAAGLSLDVHSVASFFVSRIDTKVDPRLEQLGSTELAGKAALANARAAYRRFQEIFSDASLGGAATRRGIGSAAAVGLDRRQEPGLSRHDVRRRPRRSRTRSTRCRWRPCTQWPTTVTSAGPTAEHDPAPDLEALEKAGIDLEEVTDQLLVEGVEQFEQAMDRLLAGIEERRVAVATGRPPTIEGNLPPELAEPVAARVKRAVSERVAERIWRRDPSLWGGPGVPEIENRLGWLTVADAMLEHAPALKRFAQEVKAEGFTDCVLLGMGGSSLGPGGHPQVLRRAARRAAAAGARLDPPRRGARCPGVG